MEKKKSEHCENLPNKHNLLLFSPDQHLKELTHQKKNVRCLYAKD